MAAVSRKCTIIRSVQGLRYGHMVNLPGNKWSHRDWPKQPKKRWIPTKGTKGYKLDSVEPPEDLFYKTVDPILTKYAYQVDAHPKTETCDPVEYLCHLTNTAKPLPLSSLGCGEDVNSSLLSDFVKHVEHCCLSFNSLLHQKQIDLIGARTPLQLDRLARHYSSGFMQSVLLFLFSRGEMCGPHLSDSYFSTNHHTAAFWRHSVMSYSERICTSFQFRNFIDLMVRSSQKLEYRELSGEGLEKCPSPGISLPDICSKRLHLFKETRQVEQYPGFIKETIFPYNHTLFTVVSSELSDRAMQAAALMTGFGQTVATTQHRIDFPCRVDLLPAVTSGEAVNVIVTDGNRYCIGVYQCNTTNICGTQSSTSLDAVNACAISPVHSLVAQGQLNTDLLAQLLSLMTANPTSQCSEEHSRQSSNS